MVCCFKIYWRYSMATGGWIFQTGGAIHAGVWSRRIIQQFSSSVIFISFFFFKNFARFFRQNPLPNMVVAFWWRWQNFCLSTVSTHLFQLKATIFLLLKEIFVCWWKKHFPLDSKNRHFTPLWRVLLFFGGDFWECRFFIFWDWNYLKSLKQKLMDGCRGQSEPA